MWIPNTRFNLPFFFFLALLWVLRASLFLACSLFSAGVPSPCFVSSPNLSALLVPLPLFVPLLVLSALRSSFVSSCFLALLLLSHLTFAFRPFSAPFLLLFASFAPFLSFVSSAPLLPLLFFSYPLLLPPLCLLTLIWLRLRLRQPFICSPLLRYSPPLLNSPCFFYRHSLLYRPLSILVFLYTVLVLNLS
jgi:hypothetical protein